MEKYKLCPACQAKNPPVLLECMHCEADLTGVRITDEDTCMDQELPEAAGAVRICDCGAHNAPNARKCSACGEDISDIAPQLPQEPEYLLTSLDGQYAFRLTQFPVTIGRTQAMGDYLHTKTYVSRLHARLTLEEGSLFLEDLNSTNHTFVNNQRITGKTQLHHGDELSLGGLRIDGSCQEQVAYFLLRIGPCT